MPKARRAAIAMTTAALLAAAAAHAADVTSSTVTRIYPIRGATPTALVDDFHRHPYRGDRGPALANIHPAYTLTLTTRERTGGCGVGRVSVDIAFTMTLPKAVDAAAMNSSTRALWRQVERFAKRHELGHRSRYIACARRFVAKAKAMTAPTCMALEAAIRRLQRSAQATCEASQVGYDLSEARRAGKLGLFRIAREARR